MRLIFITILALVSSGFARDFRNERRLRKYGPLPPKDKRGSEFERGHSHYFMPSHFGPSSTKSYEGYGPPSSKGYENYVSSSSKGYESSGPPASKGYEAYTSPKYESYTPAAQKYESYTPTAQKYESYTPKYETYAASAPKYETSSKGTTTSETSGQSVNLAALTYVPALPSGKNGPVTFGLGGQGQTYMSQLYSAPQALSSINLQGLHGLQGLQGYSSSQSVGIPVISLGSGYSLPAASTQSYSSAHNLGGIMIAAPQTSSSSASSHGQTQSQAQSQPQAASSYESSGSSYSGSGSNYQGSSSYQPQSSPGFHVSIIPSHPVSTNPNYQMTSGLEIIKSPTSYQTSSESYQSPEPSSHQENYSSQSQSQYQVPSTNYGTPYAQKLVYSPSAYAPTSYSNSAVSYGPAESSGSSYSSAENSYSSAPQSQLNQYSEHQSSQSNLSPMYLSYAYKPFRALQPKADPKYDTVSYSDSDTSME